MKSIVNSPLAPKAIGPYSQAVIAGEFIFLSGQIAINGDTGELVQHSIKKETEQIFHNISVILKEAGVGFDQVIKVSIFLSDMSFFAEVNEIYATYFTPPFPARETIAVKELPKNARIEISITAYKK
ncbi:MAG: Rid family detoxifying hydrolase [Phycisphaerales bacterium]|nr:Rid family detoxifying hydrolase [Phycisphaerales bacterium]